MESVTASASVLQQDFLNLLVAQLENQDPLSPMEQEEFIGQLSQLSMVEGIEKLNASFADMLLLQQLSTGDSLIGSTITYDKEGVGSVTGVVQQVNVESGNVVLQTDNGKVPLTAVRSVDR